MASDPAAGWTDLFDGAIPAKPHALWTMVIPFVEAPLWLCIEARQTDEWSYADDASCGPGGCLSAHLPQSQCIVPEGAVGALVGKVGGGSSDTSGKLFSVGEFAVIGLSEGESGAVFLTVNDHSGGYLDNGGSVGVVIRSRERAREDAPEEIVAETDGT